MGNELEHAVIVSIKVPEDEAASQMFMDKIAEVEEQLLVAIAEAGIGEFDGNEFGDGFCRLYLYSDDADHLLQPVLPIMRMHALPGSHVTTRYGGLGSRQETIDL